jgi:hypothetical protein
LRCGGCGGDEGGKGGGKSGGGGEGCWVRLGGPARSFPPFFLVRQEIFSLSDGLTVSHTGQTSFRFFDTMEIAPPHDREIAFSFKRRLLKMREMAE